MRIEAPGVPPFEVLDDDIEQLKVSHSVPQEYGATTATYELKLTYRRPPVIDHVDVKELA